MKQYQNLLKKILEHGKYRSKEDERTGTGTKGIFGYQYRCENVGESFPLLTTKEVHFKSIVSELIWKLKGETNIQYLVKNNNRIWNEWPFQAYLKKEGLEELYPIYSYEWREKMKWFAKEIKNDDDFAKRYGEVGPVYGHQFRNFGGWDPVTKTYSKTGIDQLNQAIKEIKENSASRRIIISLWNPIDLKDALLPPCPCFYQFAVLGGKLHLQVYQRSADVFLGVPFNTAQEALMLLMVAQVCNLPPGDLIHSFGDAHIYMNHMKQIQLQLSREPKKLPKLVLNSYVEKIEDFTLDDFILIGYEPYPKITGKVAV